jgi:hypothetical protein
VKAIRTLIIVLAVAAASCATTEPPELTWTDYQACVETVAKEDFRVYYLETEEALDRFADAGDLDRALATFDAVATAKCAELRPSLTTDNE